ncbi:hypothetical protein COP1_025070 [Malus domestica]|uniref:uncharacterized protein n=1 Tax=Malus domestica TaxID=3750 RepID=UPI0010AAB3B1|nr:uncharacterized protein LOC103439276 [Malus domestica]
MRRLLMVYLDEKTREIRDKSIIVDLVEGIIFYTVFFGSLALIRAYPERMLPPMLTYYRLSRMFVLLILDFIGRKFRMIIFIICRRRRRMIISKVEDSSPWSNKLAGDVMQLILRRLGLSDYVRCAAVCRSWQAIIKSNIQSRRPLAQDQVPWLMLNSHPMSTRDHRVLSPGDWKDHKFLRSWPNTIFYCTMNRMDCVGSIEGWLIMVDSALRRPEGFMKPWSFYLKNCQNPNFKIEFFFFNPISGDRVMLPSSQSTLPCRCINGPDFSVSKIIASSEPKTISQEPCFVVCLCKQGHLTYCRPRDQSWSSIDEEIPFVNGIVILGGKLYATTSLESKFLMVFEMIEDTKGNGGPLSYRVVKLITLDPNTRPSIPLPFVKTDYNGSRLEHYKGREFVHLAKDSASMELFMIFHKADYAYKPKQEMSSLTDPCWHKIMLGKTFRYTEPPKTKGFRVFKLECDIDGGPQWMEVVELGDRVLFMSNHHSAVMSYPHGQKVERNSIYFAFDYACYESIKCDFGVFSFTNKSIRHFSSSKSRSSHMLHTAPLWFVPNL